MLVVVQAGSWVRVEVIDAQVRTERDGLATLAAPLRRIKGQLIVRDRSVHWRQPKPMFAGLPKAINMQRVMHSSPGMG